MISAFGTPSPRFRPWILALLCGGSLSHPAFAQDILTAPPAIPATPVAVQENQAANPMQVFAPATAGPSTMPLQYGPATAHPHLDYQFLYGNGIESSPGHSQNSVVQSVSPGVLFNVGDHWTLDYTPSLTYYSSRSFQDTLNQSVRLGWGTAYGGDWFFSGSQSYADSSNPQVETAAQTGQETYATAFSASYQFNDEMSLDLGWNQSFNDYVGGAGVTNSLPLADSRAWSTMDWLSYQFWPRFSVGLGAGFGYDQQDGSPDSINEQYQGRVNWRATDKISFQLSGGLQEQQYLSGGESPLGSPVFGATIQYQPFETTAFSLSANRTVSQSGFLDQVTENTGVTADLNQRLLGLLHLDVSGGYQTTRYVASLFGLSTSRADDLYSFNARLTCPLLRRATVAVFYTYSDNASTQSGFATVGSAYAYSSRQVGIEINYQY